MMLPGLTGIFIHFMEVILLDIVPGVLVICGVVLKTTCVYLGNT